MPRVETVRLRVTSGEPGPPAEVRIRFNGHVLPLNPVSGAAAPGGTWEGAFDVRSVAHSVFLLGPEQGEWRISGLEAVFEGGEPKRHEFGETVLRAGEELDLWNPPPQIFEV